MKTKLLSFFTAITVGVTLTVMFQTQRSKTSQNKDFSCASQNENEVFLKKHYFSKEDVAQLLGKRVRNLKCGKIKCPLRSNNCLSVGIGETGRVTSLKPRFGTSEYTLIIEWDEPRKLRDLSFVEQGLDTFVTYVGNDDSIQFVE